MPSTTNVFASVSLQLGELDAAARQRVAQALDRGLGLELQRVVGLHAQHEVHAALEVEARGSSSAPAGRTKRPTGR